MADLCNSGGHRSADILSNSTVNEPITSRQVNDNHSYNVETVAGSTFSLYIDQLIAFAEQNCEKLDLALVGFNLPHILIIALLLATFVSSAFAFPFVHMFTFITNHLNTKKSVKKPKNLIQSVFGEGMQLPRQHKPPPASLYTARKNGMDNFGLKCKHKVHVISPNLGRNYSVRINKLTIKEPSKGVFAYVKAERPVLGIKYAEMDTEIKTLIDTGSCSNILTAPVLDKIRKETGLNLPLQKTNLTLSDYNQGTINVLGAIELPIEIEGYKLEAVFIITDESRFHALLGAPLAKHHGVNAIQNGDELKLYIASEDRFIPCRKFYDMSKDIFVETIDQIEVLPKQTKLVQVRVTESEGQRTNLDGRDVIFKSSESKLGQTEQLTKIRRQGTLNVTVTNAKDKGSIHVAPGYNIGTVKLINTGDYITEDAVEALEVANEFGCIKRTISKECFCKRKDDYLVFKLDNDTGEVTEFANLVGIKNGIKKLGWGTGDQLTPFLKHNKVDAVHLRYRTEKVDEKFAGNKAFLIVKEIATLDLEMMNNIVRFVKRNPETEFSLLQPTPCKTHSIEPLPKKVVNIGLISGIYGYEAKPFQNDEFFNISLLNNVYLVKRDIDDDKTNLYIHFPSNKINEQRSMTHVFKNLLTKYEFSPKTKIQLRFNNTRSGVYESWPGFQAWNDAIKRRNPTLWLLDEAEALGQKVDPKYVLTDETPISHMIDPIKLTHCTCMVCLYKYKKIGQWVKVARYEVRYKSDEENSDVNVIDSSTLSPLQKVNNYAIKRLKTMTLQCNEVRPSWLQGSDRNGILCQGHEPDSDVVFDYGFNPSPTRNSVGENETFSDKCQKVYLATSYADEDKFSIRNNVSSCSDDEFIGDYRLLELDNSELLEIKDKNFDYNYHDDITQEQKDAFEKMSVISEQDIEELVEKQDIKLNIYGEREDIALPTDWRQVFDIKSVPEFARERMGNLLDKYKDILSLHKGMYGRLKGLECTLETTSEEPIYTKNYPVHPGLQTFMEHLIRHMLDSGLIAETDDCWCHPVFLVHRNSKAKEQLRSGKMHLNELEQNLNNLRLVYDLRKLNQVLKPVHNESADIKSFICQLVDFKFCSLLDISQAYKSIVVAPESRKKVGFEWQSKKYCFNILCEGISTAPRLFALGLTQCLRRSQVHNMHSHPYFRQLKGLGLKLYGKYEKGADEAPDEIPPEQPDPDKSIPDQLPMDGSKVLCYVDDVTIITYKTAKDPVEAHFNAIENFFKDFSESGMLISAKKMKFFESKSIEFLGFECTPDFFRPMSDRIKVFTQVSIPKTKHQLYGLLGCFCFFINFIPSLNVKLDLLFQALQRTKKKHGEINLTEKEIQILKEVCEEASSPENLYYIKLDIPLQLMIDSSKRGVGACIRQEIEPDIFRPVLYHSKLFSRTIQISHSSYEHEILGLLTCITSRPVVFMLQASPLPIEIGMDCAAAILMLSSLDNNVQPAKITRWANKIYQSNFNFKLLHITNKLGFAGPDYLSRISEIFTKESHPVRGNILNTPRDKIKIPDFNGRKSIPFTELRQMIQENPTMAGDINEYSELSNMKTYKKGIRNLIIHGNKSIIENDKDNKPEHGEVSNIYGAFSNISRESIIKEQSRDPYTKNKISQILLEGPKRENERFRVVGGVLLVRILNKKKPPSASNYQIVLGFKATCMVCALLHSLTHAGYKKVIKLFQKHFYSQDLYSVAAEITVSCKICAMHNKMTGFKDAPLRGCITRTSHTLVVDHCLINNNKNYPKNKKIGFINIVDSVSGYSFAKMVTNTGSDQAVDAIRNAIEISGGNLRLLISDNATGLVKSKKVQQLCKQTRTIGSTGIPYSLGGKAIVENSNRQILDIVNKLKAMLHKDWTETFMATMLIYNSMPGNLFGNTEKTRREVFFKCKEDAPFDFTRSLALSQNEKTIEKVKLQIDRMIEKETQRIKKEQKKIQLEYRKRDLKKKVQVGTLVYIQKIMNLFGEKGKSKHISSIFQVVARKNFEVYAIPLIENKESKAIHVHISRCKPFTPRLSKVFMHLPSHLQMLLGHRLTEQDLIIGKKEGLLNPDFELDKVPNNLPVDMNDTEDSSTEFETDVDEVEKRSVVQFNEQYKKGEFIDARELEKRNLKGSMHGSAKSVAGLIKNSPVVSQSHKHTGDMYHESHAREKSVYVGSTAFMLKKGSKLKAMIRQAKNNTRHLKERLLNAAKK